MKKYNNENEPSASSAPITRSDNNRDSSFKKGDLVTIHGLKNATEHNGKVVTLVQFDEAKGRWEVSQIGIKLSILLKEDNIKKYEAYVPDKINIFPGMT